MIKKSVLLLIFAISINLSYSQITDVQVLSNAQTYLNHTWTATANNIAVDENCSGNIVNTPPWVQLGSNTSIPYCWGGFLSLDDFDYYLTQGSSAGDDNTDGGWAGAGCAVGLDCSGYVSRCYGLSTHYSTSMMDSYTSIFGHHNSYNDLRNGDIVNYPSHHVRMVKHINDNGTYTIIEEAFGGGLKRVFEKTYTLSELSSYNPQYLIDMVVTSGELDCSDAVTLACGVSYHGVSSTAQSSVDSYGCNDWSETGPERVHTITPSMSGPLTATISNFTGDLDVFILGACNPAYCLGTVSSASATIDNAVAGETYYIVVDSDDGSGGEYDIIVDCPEALPNIELLEYKIDDNSQGYSNGDDDGRCENGEQIEIPIKLFNSGNTILTNIHGVLSVTDPDITINEPNLYWSDMNPSSSKWSYNSNFSISENCQDKDVTFTLNLSSDQGNWTKQFTLHIYNTVSIKNIQKEKNITVYPNPTEGIVYFETKNNQIQKFDVLDINGRVLLSSENVKNKFIDLGSFPKGVYFVRFQDFKHNNTIFKIIKE
ncbi:MAG: hypothetical protein DRI94_05730 [Bacteroidetes bacterium]|nr:MAG: hypothetical protein DRI94_05730 [Bacteroidota bacterium]